MNIKSRNPDIIETLQELDAGILSSKLSKIVGDVALGVIQHSKAGKVVLTA